MKPGSDRYYQSFTGRWYLYLAMGGWCWTCKRPTLTVVGLRPVRVDQTHVVAICRRCDRVGLASRARATYRHETRGANGGSMIDPKSYPGASRPAVKPETIGYPKKTAAVLTIADVDAEVEIPEEDGGSRKVLTIVFAEFPEHTFYTNKTSREALCERLGLDETKWVRKRVPLIVVNTNNPRTKKPQASLWVADPADWEKHMSAAGGRGKR